MNTEDKLKKVLMAEIIRLDKLVVETQQAQKIRKNPMFGAIQEITCRDLSKSYKNILNNLL